MRKKYKVTIEADGEIIFIANVKREKSEREIDFEGAASDIDEAETVLYYVKEALIETML